MNDAVTSAVTPAIARLGRPGGVTFQYTHVNATARLSQTVTNPTTTRVARSQKPPEPPPSGASPVIDPPTVTAMCASVGTRANSARIDNRDRHPVKRSRFG